MVLWDSHKEDAPCARLSLGIGVPCQKGSGSQCHTFQVTYAELVPQIYPHCAQKPSSPELSVVGLCGDHQDWLLLPVSWRGIMDTLHPRSWDVMPVGSLKAIGPYPVILLMMKPKPRVKHLQRLHRDVGPDALLFLLYRTLSLAPE